MSIAADVRTSASYASAPAATIEWTARGDTWSRRILRAMPSFESSDSTGTIRSSPKNTSTTDHSSASHRSAV